jgi:hypothetical protein
MEYYLLCQDQEEAFDRLVAELNEKWRAFMLANKTDDPASELATTLRDFISREHPPSEDKAK